MVEISDSLRLLFEAPVETDGDRYVISVPSELIEDDRLDLEDAYRVALLSRVTESPAERADVPKPEPATSDTNVESDSGGGAESPNRSAGRFKRPPVEEGEVRSVTIDTLGDQGDGIARVGPGFIVIVPGTQPGDQLDVEITNVTDTVAFADPVSEPTVR